jgi:hypothetical protein
MSMPDQIDFWNEINQGRILSFYNNKILFPLNTESEETKLKPFFRSEYIKDKKELRNRERKREINIIFVILLFHIEISNILIIAQKKKEVDQLEKFLSTLYTYARSLEYHAIDFDCKMIDVNVLFKKITPIFIRIQQQLLKRFPDSQIKIIDFKHVFENNKIIKKCNYRSLFTSYLLEIRRTWMADICACKKFCKNREKELSESIDKGIESFLLHMRMLINKFIYYNKMVAQKGGKIQINELEETQ